MGNIVCYDDPCPNCGKHHRKYPQACVDSVHDQLIETQLEQDETFQVLAEARVEDMRSYAGFWELLGDDSEREGDVE